MRTEEGPRRIGLNRADRLCACHVMWHRIKVSPKPRDCRATSSEPPLVICTWYLGVLVEAYLAPRCQTGTRDSTFAGAATSRVISSQHAISSWVASRDQHGKGLSPGIVENVAPGSGLHVSALHRNTLVASRLVPGRSTLRRLYLSCTSLYPF